MQRAAAPQQFRPPFRAEDVHAAVRLENENAAAEGKISCHDKWKLLGYFC